MSGDEEAQVPSQLPGVVILRSGDRFVTRGAGILSRHCFSFGVHYDSANTAFGPLVACNDEILAPGAGFAAHPHAGLEILTWVVQGQLEYADGAGRVALARPGVVQTLRSGSGVVHSEVNTGAGVCRFVQYWIAAPAGGAATFEQRDVSGVLSGGSLEPVVELDGATLFAGRLAGFTSCELSAYPLRHVFVVRGSVTVDRVGELQQGDSARLAPSGPGELLTGSHGVDVLIWGMEPVGNAVIA